jgi:hypothetical protein
MHKNKSINEWESVYPVLGYRTELPVCGSDSDHAIHYATTEQVVDELIRVRHLLQGAYKTIRMMEDEQDNNDSNASTTGGAGTCSTD